MALKKTHTSWSRVGVMVPGSPLTDINPYFLPFYGVSPAAPLEHCNCKEAISNLPKSEPDLGIPTKFAKLPKSLKLKTTSTSRWTSSTLESTWADPKIRRPASPKAQWTPTTTKSTTWAAPKVKKPVSTMAPWTPPTTESTSTAWTTKGLIKTTTSERKAVKNRRTWKTTRSISGENTKWVKQKQGKQLKQLKHSIKPKKGQTPGGPKWRYVWQYYTVVDQHRWF